MNVFFILCFALLASSSSNTENQNLSGHWTLICYENTDTRQRDCRPKAQWQKGRLAFQFSDDGKQGELRGKTTSNRVFGSYQLRENQNLEVLSFGGTKVAERGWGKDFWEHINQVTSYEHQHDTLRLYYDFNKCMIFVPYQAVEEGIGSE